MKMVVPSLKGVGSDIKKPGVTELAYDRTPTRAAATLPGLWRVTERDLGKIAAPVLVFKSSEDHVVGPASLEILRGRLPAARLEVRELTDSYHVATMDNDAAAIFAGSLDFVRSHSHAGKE
jgi:carboxylesterase